MEKLVQMPVIIDLGMYDDEYLMLIAQGLDPAREQLYKQKLIRAGVPPEDAYHVVPLLMSQDLSTDEEAIVWGFWQMVIA